MNFYSEHVWRKDTIFLLYALIFLKVLCIFISILSSSLKFSSTPFSWKTALLNWNLFMICLLKSFPVSFGSFLELISECFEDDSLLGVIIKVRFFSFWMMFSVIWVCNDWSYHGCLKKVSCFRMGSGLVFLWLNDKLLWNQAIWSWGNFLYFSFRLIWAKDSPFHNK